jgi:hypothetical protein
MRALLALLALLAAALAQAAWCGCAGTVAQGAFSSVLALQSTSNITVLIGDTVSSPHATAFSQDADPQALVQHLSHTFAGGQAVAAAQLLTRCARYTRGGFHAMATTSFVIAARNRSILTWLHVELDLYAACSSARDTNVFRVARPSIRVLPVELPDLDTQTDDASPLIDARDSVCRGSAQRTIGDLVRNAQICGPAAGDALEGAYFARNASRRYAKVCAYDDAVFCAADAMTINQITLSDEEPDSDLFTFGKYNHAVELYQPAPDIPEYQLARFVVDVTASGQSRQLSSLFARSDPEMVLPSVTVAQLIQNITLQNNFIANETVVERADISCNPGIALLHHHCDPLVSRDRAVQFGPAPATGSFYYAVGAGAPCLPAVTAACPAIRLPSPVFSHATTAGIVVESAACAIILAMISATVWEYLPSAAKPAAKPLPAKPVAKPAQPSQSKSPPLATPKTVSPPPRKDPELVKMDLSTLWGRTNVTFHSKKKSSKTTKTM